MSDTKTPQEARAWLQEIAEELVMLREMDNLEMYRRVTEFGKELEGISDEERTDENFVYGCVSNVYVADEVRNGRIYYRGVSDAHVIRGFLAIMIEALNGLTPHDVVASTRESIEEFAEAAEIKSTLTPNRANAFGNIYQLMVEKAARRDQQ